MSARQVCRNRRHRITVLPQNRATHPEQLPASKLAISRGSGQEMALTINRLALALLLASAAALSCPPAEAAPRTIDAQKVFDSRCARCHALERVARSIARQPAESREAWLVQYLQKHYPPDEPTRQALAAWLNEKAGGY